MYRELSRVVVAAAVIGAAPAQAWDSTEMLPFALMGGTPGLDLRLRTEHVDNDSTTQVRDSTATTLRARLGFTTGKWNDLDASFEYEGVTALDKFDYNNTLPTSTVTNRPAIADPTGTELNQAWLRYSGIPQTTLQAGRVRHVLDNQRWVGNVGWRQNEQTYDGGVLVNKSIPGVEISYAHFHNVNSIIFTNFPLRANLANVSYSPGAFLKAVAYGYWLDFEAVNIGNRQDGQSVGLRLTGAPALTDAVKLVYTAEYAEQRRYEESAVAADVDYLLGELGAAIGPTTIKVGYEQLGSNNGLYALQTPLATLHAHNGWADLFLTTPPKGLQDGYVVVTTTLAGVSLLARAHQFASEFGGADYGEEYDASLGYNFTKQLGVMIKYARYNATEAAGAGPSFAGNVDTEKGWLQLEYKF